MIQPELTAPWWRNAVIYQIYPRSFHDSDGDGIGDLAGIRARLGHLQWLGVDAIWLSPFYRSPMKDFGYDISDHCDVDPLFGSLAEFDALQAEARARGIRIIVDYAPNHTSDQHPWFSESRSSRASRKRDWYIWRDPAPDGGPPNNWTSRFGGSAWEWDAASGQYYYHCYLKEQPDLNWRNPDVRAAMLDILRFWLARGVDGFRVDAISNLFEDILLRDEPDRFSVPEGIFQMVIFERVFTADRPETQEAIADMRALVDAAGDKLLIGEAHLLIQSIVSYYGGRRPGFHLPFNFIFLQTPWQARSIAAAIDQYLALLPEGGWPNWLLGNHDEPRIASRIGRAQARVAAMLTMTLRGTCFMYYGDELGLTDTDLSGRAQQDPVAASLGASLGRDPQRTPMPWDDSHAGGFTRGTPWLPLGADYQARNVDALRADSVSIQHLYRALIALRRAAPALARGSHRPAAFRGDVFGFYRTSEEQDILVLLNLGSQLQHIALDSPARILLSTHLDREGETASTVSMRPDEGLILERV